MSKISSTDELSTLLGQGGGEKSLAGGVRQRAGPEQAFETQLFEPIGHVVGTLLDGVAGVIGDFTGQLKLCQRAGAEPPQNDEMMLRQRIECIDHDPRPPICHGPERR